MNQPATHSPAPTSPLDTHRALFANELATVDALTEGLGDGQVPLIPQIIAHIIRADGKRLRPILTILSAKLCGYREGTRHTNLAACVELLHTATLLHDDLVDKSELRRGVKTAHEVFGNVASVLVGDFLLSQSFHIMAQDSLPVLRILSDATVKITQGEVHQLTARGDVTTGETDYIDIITAKTATLFAAATQIGAAVADVDDATQAAMHRYGSDLGIAFQLVDDALDYSAHESQLGKGVGDDFREGKMTLPVIIAYAEGTEEERTFWQQVIESPETQTDADLATAQELIVKYDALTKTIARASDYADSAAKQLAVLPDIPEKQALKDLATFTVDRPY